MSKNFEALSPIIATFVLFIVAVIGASTVGLLLGSFSNDISKDTNYSIDTSDFYPDQILIAGSNIMYPAELTIADWYMSNNSDVKITVVRGSSALGLTAVALNRADIGSSSTTKNSNWLPNYPDLVGTPVGGNKVVMIANTDLANSWNSAGTCTRYDVAYFYGVPNKQTYTFMASPQDPGGLAAIATLTEVVRSERVEDIEEIIAKWASNTEKYPAAAPDFAKPAAQQTSFKGNSPPFGITMITKGSDQEVIAEVAKGDATNGIIGFCDYSSIANGYPNVDVLTIDNSSDRLGTNGVFWPKDQYPYMWGKKSYDQELFYDLYFYTNGEPNLLLKRFIFFAQSEDSVAVFHDNGLSGYIDLYS